ASALLGRNKHRRAARMGQFGNVCCHVRNGLQSGSTFHNSEETLRNYPKRIQEKMLRTLPHRRRNRRQKKPLSPILATQIDPPFLIPQTPNLCEGFAEEFL